MTKQEAQAKLKDYLKRHFIYTVAGVADGVPQLSMGYKNLGSCPGGSAEGCVFFFKNEMEVRAYYTKLGADICASSSHRAELFRLLNYINAAVWHGSVDWRGKELYDDSLLYTPRMYMTEDGCFDITLTTVVNYDFYELAPVETADFITAFLPEMLDRLAPAVFGVLHGELTAEEAIERLKSGLV